MKYLIFLIPFLSACSSEDLYIHWLIFRLRGIEPMEATKELAKIGEPALVKLRSKVESCDTTLPSNYCNHIYFAIGRMGKSGISVLAGILEKYHRKHMILVGLGMTDHPDAIPIIEKYLKWPMYQPFAIMALEEMSKDKAAFPILNFWKSPENKNQDNSLIPDALAKIGNPVALPMIQKELARKDIDESYRSRLREASIKLKKIKDNRATE